VAPNTAIFILFLSTKQIHLPIVYSSVGKTI
jgi:hypothetical protein